MWPLQSEILCPKEGERDDIEAKGCKRPFGNHAILDSVEKVALEKTGTELFAYKPLHHSVSIDGTECARQGHLKQPKLARSHGKHNQRAEVVFCSFGQFWVPEL